MVVVKGPLDPVEEIHTDTVGHSMTQQQFKQECDINYILSRYSETGCCDHVMNKEPRYMDCSSLTAKTFQDHLEFAFDFEEHFDSLPQEIRDRFEDDPTLMMEYLSDESNYDEAVKLGILASDGSSEVTQRSEVPVSDQALQTPSLEGNGREEKE